MSIFNDIKKPFIHRGKGNPYGIRNYVLVIIIFCLALITFLWDTYNNFDRWWNEFKYISDDRISGIQKEYELSFANQASINALYYSSTEVTEDEFRVFNDSNPGLHKFNIIALEWITRVSAAKRTVFENKIRQRHPGFSIWEKDPNGMRVRAGKRPEYFPVTYLYPEKGNEIALGFDLGSEPVRLAALEKAALTGKAAMTGAVTLVQGSSSNLGYLVFLPLFRNKAVPQTEAERKESLTGFTLGVYTYGAILEHHIKEKIKKYQDIYIFQDISPEARPVYHHIPGFRGEHVPLEDNLPSFAALTGRIFAYTRSVSMAENKITYVFLPGTQDFWTNFFEIGTFIILFGGLAIAFFVFVFTTRRIEIQQRITEDEQRYRTLVEVMPEGIFVNREGKIQYLNNTMMKILGAEKPDQILGRAPLAFFHPDYHDKVRERIALALNEKKPLPLVQFKMVRLDGTSVDVETTGCSFQTGNGWAIQVVVRDITERLSAEKALRESDQRFHDLFNNMSSGVAVYEAVDEGRDFVIRGFNKAGERLDRTPHDLVIGRRVTEVFPGVREMGMLDLLFRVWKTGTAEQQPVSQYKDGRISAWRENRIFRLPSGEVVAIYDDVTDRRLAEKALQESEERLRLFIEHAPASLAMFNRDMRYLAASHRWLSDFDMAEKNILGCSHYDLFPEITDAWKEVHRRALSGEVVRADEDCFTREDGSVQWLRWEVRPWHATDGTVGGIVIFSEDITALKITAEEKRMAMAKYKTLFDTFPLGITVADRDGRIIEGNAMAEKLLGLSPEEQERRAIDGEEWQIVRSDGSPMPPKEYASVRAITENRPVSNIEMGLLNPRGGITWLSVTAAPIEGEGVVISYGDISEKKQAEQDLRESEERFSKMFHSSPACQVITTFPDGKIIDANKAWCKMMGYSREEILGKYTAEMGLWRSPEDREAAYSLFTDNGHIDSREVIFRRSNGELITILASVEHLDLKGEQCVISTMMDITERKRTSDALRKSQEKYRELVENLNDVIYTQDLNGTLTYISPVIERLSGYKTDDITGKVFTGFIHPDDIDEVIASFGRNISGAGEPSEFRILDMDGSVRYVRSSTHPIYSGGTVTGLTGILTDITERKNAEEALLASEARYRLIFDSAAQGIIIADTASMKFMFVNHAMCRIFGYAEEEFTHLSVANLHPPEFLPMIVSKFESMAIGEITFANDIPCMRKDGTRIYVDISSNHIVLEGKAFLIGFFIDTTERVKSQKMLEASEEQYRNLIENSHDLIQSVDTGGRFIYVNRRWQEVLGYDNKDLESLNVFDIIHPDFREQCRREFTRILEGEQISYLHPLMTTKDGWLLEMEGSSVPQRLDDNTITINTFFMDVTERNRLERIKSLRLAVTNIISRFGSIEESLEQALSAIGTEGQWECGELWWYDPSGNVLNHMRSWSGIKSPELDSFITMSHTFQFQPGEGLPGHAWQKRSVIWTRNVSEEPFFFRKEAALLAGIKSSVAIPINDKKMAMGVIILLSSRERPIENDLLATLGEIGIQLGMFISRKRLETELEEERLLLARRVEERTMELNEATVAAQAANKSKSDFLASMSHELRTPLNSVIGFSELMLNGMAGDLNKDQKEFLDDIYDSGKHLLSLINDILDLSKVESGKMELELSSVSINNVLNKVRSYFKEKTIQRGIAFNIESGIPDVDDTIDADERKIKQILLNLVSNAVKFTPDEGRIDIRADLVSEHGTRFIKFMVKDSGIGISAENQKRLFMPFQQLDNTSTRKYTGTGLGLSLCKSYAELHGGSIWVKSEVNRGATFSFTIPFKKSIEG